MRQIVLATLVSLFVIAPSMTAFGPAVAQTAGGSGPGGPGPDVPCDGPTFVDECGDSMTGDLVFDGAVGNVVFSGSKGVSFPGGLLFANTALTFGSNQVCLASVTINGCSANGDITSVSAGSGLSGGGLSGDVTLSIGAGGIATSMIADLAVTGAKLADLTVSSVKLADGSVSTGKLVSGAVTSDKIGSGAVDGSKIATSAVASSHIADGSVSSADIADSAVASVDIADGGVGSADIADGAVTSNDIADGTVSGTDIADASVGGADITDGSIGIADLGFDPATQTELDTHKGSGDHDARYARDFHDHGAKIVHVSGTTIIDGTDVTVLSIAETTADECAGSENHNYRVEASGYVFESSGISHPRLEVSIDSASLAYGESHRGIGELDAAAGKVYSVPYHTMLYLTNVQPGSHTFRLLAEALLGGSLGGYVVSRATLFVEHLGWTCA